MDSTPQIVLMAACLFVVVLGAGSMLWRTWRTPPGRTPPGRTPPGRTPPGWKPPGGPTST